ncbi:MAG TPA: tetratricopeptide repeat protein [Ktedonobacteraceae bacterium]|jgi:tetratricopeptide (TPR) repeat protein|nr:tetratricopeptide repeat protein [Ktedonobacteraceae bacterium]
MPGNRQVFSTAMNAADRLRWDSQWEEAAREYQRALAEFPDDAAARGGLGFCYMQTKQWQKALDEYEHILSQDHSNVIALSKTAELYVILNRRDEAYKAYLHLAELYSQAGQGARAEAAWQKAVQLSPASPEPHERLAAYYFGKKDIAMMVQERLSAAQGYLLRNELASARAQCEQVLRIDANNTQAQQFLIQLRGQQPSGGLSQGAGTTSGPLAAMGTNTSDMVSNISGGNTSIMGNMGSAGNYGGGNPAVAAGGMQPASNRRITASQVTGVLRQAQTFQAQGRFTDAIDLCEQIIESGFDRPDARYFLGWLYQEQQRWDDAIRQFQTLLNDPDYALSCYYALGQCYRAKGDLRTATMHFDEAVDRVNLDALTVEESDQLVQLCQEAAEAHRQLGEQEQALTVYNALLGFLRSRGWNDKVAQVEFMLKQLQNTPVPQRPLTPPPGAQDATRVFNTDQPTMMQPQVADAATMAFTAPPVQPVAPQPAPPPVNPVVPSAPVSTSGLGELPDWLTGILNDADKTQLANKPPAPPAPVPPQVPAQPSVNMQPAAAEQTQVINMPTSSSWLTEGAQPNTTRQLPPEQPTMVQQPVAAQPTPFAPPPPLAPAQPQVPVAPAQPVVPVEASPAQPVQPVAAVQQPPVAPAPQPVQPAQPPVPAVPAVAAASTMEALVPPPVVPPVPAPEPPVAPAPTIPVPEQPIAPILQTPPAQTTGSAEELLSQIAGLSSKEGILQHVADSVLASTANLPENVRVQVIQSMQDIQRYIDHGLLTPAMEECLRIIDIAPQYLDVHQVLCEIYIRQGKVEQAITKYGILIDTFVVNGRIDDAIATYRRILQLEPNNLTYRVRLINLLSAHGHKEDLLRERTLAAESYLRLGYMDRALTELEQALQESPTSVPTRLNYALALQKLGRTSQAVAEYQRVLQVDPRNITALVRWHITMITGMGTSRATALEILSRIRWQLRGEGLRHYDMVIREYNSAAETYPNNFDVRFAQGQIHQQAGQFDHAIDAYQMAMRDSSLEVLARTSSAQCLLAQGKPEAAIQQLEQALQIVRSGGKGAVEPSVWAARPREEGEEHQAPEIEISMLLAKTYGRVGKQEQMQAILRQVKQSTANRDEVSSALAEISARQGDIDSALQEYIELAQFYRSKRQTDNALSVLKEMVRVAPQDPRAHAELGDIYISRGHLEEGIAELRLLADIYLRRNRMEEAGETLWRIGNVCSEMGNPDEAFMNLRRAVDLLPNNMDLLREMVAFCWQTSRTREATQYQTIIARHYFETHQVKESVAALQQLIAIDRNNFEAYDMLGQTYQSVGEYEQASRVYKNLAKADPSGTIARERLAALQELRAQSA